ncbi:hypothetical protein IWW51_006399 [Coemansia sp. RSA 2702]|nr:hypothetical protein IWW51_006399 [Coemansia sp. RSA 2702]
MDLIGTLALPAAIVFTLYIIIISTFTRPVPWLPLALLAVILGLPAVLIGLTSRKLVYIGWMLIYLLSLPVWNFVLPTYAYWHFDDFSWGQTRMVQGESKDKGHGGKDGEFDSTQIVMKRWCDFEAEKRRKTQAILGSVPSLAALALSSSQNMGDAHSLSARQSRMLVASRPVSVANSGSSHQVATADSSPQIRAQDSEEQMVSTVGQTAALHQAASAMLHDPDAQAAAGSIERLGYMTPNIIPVLASQNLSRQSRILGTAPSSLASPTGPGPMSPDSSNGPYSNSPSASQFAMPVPHQFVSRPQSSRGSSPEEKGRPS